MIVFKSESVDGVKKFIPDDCKMVSSSEELRELFHRRYINNPSGYESVLIESTLCEQDEEGVLKMVQNSRSLQLNVFIHTSGDIGTLPTSILRDADMVVLADVMTKYLAENPTE